MTNTEAVAGTTFTISYDSIYATLKDVKLASRTSGFDLIRNGNTITITKQDGSKAISKGSGAVVNLYFTPGKKGLNTASLKITEVKAANPIANKIAVGISGSRTVGSGTILN